jgi:magnesium chelatase subunit I
VQWFDLGGEIQLSDSVPAVEALENLDKIQGLLEKLGPLGISEADSPEQRVSAAEFILEGLHAHKRIGRSEERVFKGGEKKAESVREKSFEPDERPYRQRRQFN